MTPLQQLGLPADATQAEVRDAFRIQAKLHHPDAGGDPVKFQQLKAAYDQALAEAPEQRVCRVCRGKGQLPVRRGFDQAFVACQACDGSGRGR